MAIESKSTAITDGTGNTQIEHIAQRSIGKEGISRTDDQHDQQIDSIMSSPNDDADNRMIDISTAEHIMSRICRIGDGIPTDNRPTIAWPEIIQKPRFPEGG